MTGDAAEDPAEDPAEAAARRAAERARIAHDIPEPSLAKRFGQIGILGWVIVLPVLLGVLAGRQLDRWLGTGITFAAALLVAGAALGFWMAWRWMHAQ